MKTVITKADGSPVKSRIHAVQFLNKNGIDKSLLIEENGKFYYDDDINGDTTPAPSVQVNQPSKSAADLPVSWETEVFDKNNNKTRLYIPNTDVVATINAKLPAGQLRNKSCFEINIGDENFVMSVDLVGKIFKVRG